MKTIKLSLAAVSAGLVLAACSGQQIITPENGQSEAQMVQDKQHCINVAASYYGASNTDLGTSDVYLECLKAKGYSNKTTF
jgi:outer membrane biogenesis lipoprotein LolB